MKFEITTNAKSVEVANFLISQAIKSLEENDDLREAFQLSKKDLTRAETFRKQLLKGFFKAAKS